MWFFQSNREYHRWIEIFFSLQTNWRKICHAWNDSIEPLNNFPCDVEIYLPNANILPSFHSVFYHPCLYVVQEMKSDKKNRIFEWSLNWSMKWNSGENGIQLNFIHSQEGVSETKQNSMESNSVMWNFVYDLIEFVAQLTMKPFQWILKCVSKLINWIVHKKRQ